MNNYVTQYIDGLKQAGEKRGFDKKNDRFHEFAALLLVSGLKCPDERLPQWIRQQRGRYAHRTIYYAALEYYNRLQYTISSLGTVISLKNRKSQKYMPSAWMLSVGWRVSQTAAVHALRQPCISKKQQRCCYI
jgi:hypothetical protein